MGDDQTADCALVDFGDGRKLERLGGCLVDRPAPACAGVNVANPELWQDATARYTASGGGRGTWKSQGELPQPWQAKFGQIVIELGLRASGQVGLFPEQITNWSWLAQRIADWREHNKRAAPEILNLFGYSGGSTLAAALGGARVTHVDASRSAVLAARRNAAASGVPADRVRWIVDDVATFVDREWRRGRTYAGVILDPPSYGHGSKGQQWKIERDLAELLCDLIAIVHEPLALVLLTWHTAGLESEIASILPDLCGSRVKANKVFLTSETDGRRLPAGWMARWPA